MRPRADQWSDSPVPEYAWPGRELGNEITAWLREQGFSDIAEGTVCALLIRIEQRGLVDVEKVPSEKGPPRKVYTGTGTPRGVLEDQELPL